METREREHRDGARPTGRRPRVAVVGGGISGLVAAWRLRDVADVVVLEQSPVLGGKLRIGAVGDVETDVGAESFLARRPEAVGLVRELGYGGLLVHPVTAAANVLRDGVLHPLPPGTVMGVPSRPEALAGLLQPDEVARAATEPGGAVPVDEDVDVASWVGDRFGPAVVDRVVEPLLGGVYAGQARLLSARATLPALWAQAATAGSLAAAARAVVEAGTAAQTAGAPVFAGLAGGVGRLPGLLADALAAAGVTLRTGVTARVLERTGSGWRLTLGPVPDPEYVTADAVVLAVPAAPAGRLLAPVAPRAGAELAQVEAASVAVVACLVPREALAGLPGSGLLVPPAEGRPVKAMTFAAAKWAWVDALDARHVVVRLSLGRHREEAVLQRDDAELTALAVADAGAALGRDLRPVATRVVRWGGGLPQPAVGHLARIERVRAAVAEHPGLAVCGAALDGVGIPACIAAAGLAAAQVARDLPGSRVRMPVGESADR